MSRQETARFLCQSRPQRQSFHHQDRSFTRVSNSFSDSEHHGFLTCYRKAKVKGDLRSRSLASDRSQRLLVVRAACPNRTTGPPVSPLCLIQSLLSGSRRISLLHGVCVEHEFSFRSCVGCQARRCGYRKGSLAGREGQALRGVAHGGEIYGVIGAGFLVWERIGG